MATDSATPKYADGSTVPDHIDSTTRAWLDGVDPNTGARVQPQDVTPAEAAKDTAERQGAASEVPKDEKAAGDKSKAAEKPKADAPA